MNADPDDQDADRSGPDDPVLVEWAAELALRMREGKTLDWPALARQHPAQAEALRHMLPAFDLVAGLGGSSQAGSARADGSTESLPGLAQLGDFRLLRVVGHGGMGVVYEAFQSSLNRRVALKVLPPTAAMDARQVQRFQVEARAAALLQHDRIVAVHAVGCEQGVPFYAMQFIEGQSVAQYIRALARGTSGEPEPTTERTDLAQDDLRADELLASSEGPAVESDRYADDTERPPLSADSPVRRHDHIRTTAALGLEAAEALAHAHAKGVIHRDIKPGNLLLDTRGKVWLTDFGLARVQTDPNLTATGTLLGTLRYMSPEQAAGSKAAVDHRTDVYSLGATLYELLTLRPAVPGRDARTILRRLTEDDPPPIRSLNPAVPLDLQTIVMKALSRDAGARYASANVLGEDLRRFLAGEPILASPPSVATRLRRWGGRHKPIAAAAAVCAIVLAVAFAVWTFRGDPDRAVVAHLVAEHQSVTRKNEQLGKRNQYLGRAAFVSSLRNAAVLLKSGRLDRCQELVHAIEEGGEGFDPGEFAWRYVRSRARAALGPIWPEGVAQAFANPDGKTLVIVGFLDANLRTPIRMLDRSTLRVRTAITAPGAIAPPSSVMRSSPDGRLLYGIEQQPASGQPQRLWVWESATGKLRAELKLEPGRRAAGVLPLAGERFLVCANPSAELPAFDLWMLRPDGLDARFVTEVVSSRACSCFASVDGRTLAVAEVVGPAGRIRLFDVLAASFRDRPEALVTKGRIDIAVFSSDGQVLVAEDNATEVVFLELSTGRTLGRYALGREVPSKAFSASSDGRTAAVFDRGSGLVTFWDRDGGRVQTLGPGEAQGRFERELLFSPDGLRFATLAETPDGLFTAVWDTRTRTVSAKLAEEPRMVGEMSFTPDGRELCIDSRIGPQKWRIDVCEPTRLAGHSDEAWAVAFSPDGHVLASGSDDGVDPHTIKPHTIKLYDAATGALIRGWFAGEGTVSGLAFSPDRRVLASSHLVHENNIRIWEVDSGKPVATLSGHKLPARAVTFSRDGALLATCEAYIGKPNRAGAIHLWNAHTWVSQRILNGHTLGIMALAFSPDGMILASGGDDSVRLWDLASGRHSALPETRTGALAFSPDGGTLAFASEARSVCLQAVSASAPRAVLRGEAGELKLLTFAPDGSAVATTGESGVIRLFDVVTREELLSLEGHASKVHGLAFSPDGSALASCSHDGAVFLWRAAPRDDDAGR